VFFEGDPGSHDGRPVNQAPGHQEIELALCKLYRATGNSLYIEMARKVLDIRGVTYRPDGEGVMSAQYAQQHRPVREQDRAVGHAVRAAYLYSGMADVSALTGDPSYRPALERIWENIVNDKMHITGGLGAVHGIEGFGPDFVLPNLEAYNETCAAIANVFFNRRLFLLHGDAKHFDVAEAALFNNALAGVNFEGNRFFYVDPLEADAQREFNHGSTGRSPWFDCACCPSNIARLITQVTGYLYAASGRELYTLLYGASNVAVQLNGSTVAIEQRTEYPFDGRICLTVSPSAWRPTATVLPSPAAPSCTVPRRQTTAAPFSRSSCRSSQRPTPRGARTPNAESLASQRVPWQVSQPSRSPRPDSMATNRMGPSSR